MKTSTCIAHWLGETFPQDACVINRARMAYLIRANRSHRHGIERVRRVAPHTYEARSRTSSSVLKLQVVS